MQESKQNLPTARIITIMATPVYRDESDKTGKSSWDNIFV